MHPLDRALQHRRVASSLMVATAAASTLALTSSGAAGAAMITKCPPAGALKAAAGTSLTLRSAKNIAGVVACDYTHALPNFKQYSVSFAVDPMQYSDAAFVNVVKTFAKDLNAPLKTLKGVGDEAWEYTEKSNSTTTVTIVVGKKEVSVVANIPARNVLALAKQVS